MYNPFVKLSPELFHKMIQQPKLFVRQYFERGNKMNNTTMVPILLTYYEKNVAIEANRAKFHFSQLLNDKYRFLYDSENIEHKQRLMQAALQPRPYEIYVNLLPEKWQPPLTLRNQIHHYMIHHFKLFKPSQALNIHLKDRYGKLFILLSWKGNHAEVPLDEIENF